MMVRTPHTVQTQRSRLFRVCGQDVAAPQLPPGLYLVATPIGNLNDVTLRALETLAGVEAIACEDTRATRRLLERYAITTPLSIYHDPNAELARPQTLPRLAAARAI